MYDLIIVKSNCMALFIAILDKSNQPLLYFNNHVTNNIFFILTLRWYSYDIRHVRYILALYWLCNFWTPYQVNDNHWINYTYGLKWLNPLLPSAHKSARIGKRLILELEGIIKKNFLWASRLWVGRRKELILGYVSKNYKKGNSGTKGL